MKRFLAVFPVALLVAACGSSHSAATNAQVQTATKKADQVILKCLPNPVALLSHSGRQKFVSCAVPPSRQRAFETCLEHVALSGYPTKARLKNGAESCLAKAA